MCECMFGRGREGGGGGRGRAGRGMEGRGGEGRGGEGRGGEGRGGEGRGGEGEGRGGEGRGGGGGRGGRQGPHLRCSVLERRRVKKPESFFCTSASLIQARPWGGRQCDHQISVVLLVQYVYTFRISDSPNKVMLIIITHFYVVLFIMCVLRSGASRGSFSSRIISLACSLFPGTEP